MALGLYKTDTTQSPPSSAGRDGALRGREKRNETKAEPDAYRNCGSRGPILLGVQWAVAMAG